MAPADDGSWPCIGAAGTYGKISVAVSDPRAVEFSFLQSAVQFSCHILDYFTEPVLPHDAENGVKQQPGAAGLPSLLLLSAGCALRRVLLQYV